MDQSQPISQTAPLTGQPPAAAVAPQPISQTAPLTGQPAPVAAQAPVSQTAPLTGKPPAAAAPQPISQTDPLTGRPAPPLGPIGRAILPYTGDAFTSHDATLSYIGMMISLLLFALGSVVMWREWTKRRRTSSIQ